MLLELPGWSLGVEGNSIRREWTVRNFMAGIDFFKQVAALAEEEGHHTDLHMVGYRRLAIDLTTHAIGGLSENDFILAAKIDEIPIQLKR
jgi:4a-hydroxytetrahydrobiopterin dehydratase